MIEKKVSPPDKLSISYTEKRGHLDLIHSVGYAFYFRHKMLLQLLPHLFVCDAGPISQDPKRVWNEYFGQIQIFVRLENLTVFSLNRPLCQISLLPAIYNGSDVRSMTRSWDNWPAMASTSARHPLRASYLGK